MSVERMSFYIALNENPTKWIEHEESSLLSEQEYEIWVGLSFPHREDHHHPCVKYEDVIGHLFMQAVGLMYHRHVTRQIIKSARQYANQIMKNVCLNCRHSRGTRYPDDLTAPGLSMKSSKRFAMDIQNCETHNNCQSCRVAKIIVLGNSFDELLYARTSGDTRNKYWRRLTTEIIRRTKWRKRARKAEFTLKKVIESKNLMKTNMQREIDILQTFKDLVYISPMPAPTDPLNRACKVVFDEFSKLSDKQLDELSKTPYIRNAIAAQKGMFRIPGPPTAEDTKKVHKVIKKIPEGKHPLEVFLSEVFDEEEREDPPLLPVEKAVLEHKEEEE